MNRIVVYSKSGCPFCSLLKAEMNRRSIAFEEVDLSDNDTRRAFYDAVGDEVNTVPQVFVVTPEDAALQHFGRRLGGWSEVSKSWDSLGI